MLSLARIGVDNVSGVLAGGFDTWRDAGMPIARSGAIAPRELEKQIGRLRVLDVRDDTEFESEGHIPRASHLYVGYLEKHLREIEPPLDKAERVAVACSVGHRASLAASILRRQGFEHVDNLARKNLSHLIGIETAIKTSLGDSRADAARHGDAEIRLDQYFLKLIERVLVKLPLGERPREAVRESIRGTGEAGAKLIEPAALRFGQRLRPFLTAF